MPLWWTIPASPGTSPAYISQQVIIPTVVSVGMRRKDASPCPKEREV